jgi:hypothetical protein
MPNLDFYACSADMPPLLDFIRDHAGCRVFESYSGPAEPLREFSSTSEVMDALACEVGGLGLMLYAASMRGTFEVERFALRPSAFPGSPAWREQIRGWGLIGLRLEVPRNGKLRPSHTNHNSEKRAQVWSEQYRDQAPPDTWDFREVTRISSQINRYVRTHLAAAKHGSMPILRHASDAVAAGELTLLLA